MTPFAEILARTATRKGGKVALEQILATTAPRPPAEIASTPDDRILAEMTRRIFYAGFSSKVIDDKWPAFEAGFDGFDPSACAFMSEEHFDRLLQDRGIVRNGAKIKSVQINAKICAGIEGGARGGGPVFRELARHRLCWSSGCLEEARKPPRWRHRQSFSSHHWQPAFITSPDMVSALVREGVIDRAPTGRRDLAIIQAAFNKWCGVGP